MEANNDQRKLTPIEQKHSDFMLRIAQSMINSPAVLKGGTALMLAYGLNRFSEDLDFDSTKSLNLEKKINDSAKLEGVTVNSIKLKKDTDTTKRYVVFYESEQGEGRLKIETSLRDDNIPQNSTTEINGIKTYQVENLVSQKLAAIEGRSKVRDLYDINFLSETNPEAFTPEQANKLKNLTSNPDLLVSRFEADHSKDNILKTQSLDELALKAQYNAESIEQRAKNHLTAKDFETLKQDDFLKKHPGHAAYVAAYKLIESEINKQALSERHSAAATDRLKANIADSIKQGVQPDLKITQQKTQSKDLQR